MIKETLLSKGLWWYGAIITLYTLGTFILTASQCSHVGFMCGSLSLLVYNGPALLIPLSLINLVQTISMYTMSKDLLFLVPQSDVAFFIYALVGWYVLGIIFTFIIKLAKGRVKSTQH
jgi:hypothetical protein